ncbi:macro domain-containing protein [Hymenobacter sp. 5414T-23]|uniref:macro domain-containing protein n=1 Tax=Hymenobacter TaxID=89966 RepID=UPI00397D7030
MRRLSQPEAACRCATLFILWGSFGPGATSHEPELLAYCYHNSLQLACEKDPASVASPSISTGIYGYLKQETRQFLE